MTVDELMPKLLTAIANKNLIVLAGAGLSITRPSNVPAAATVSHNAFQTHKNLTGQTLPPEFEWDLEKIACHFRKESNLTYFIRRLIDWTPFRAVPNRGHLALADFLACAAIDGAITTNFDTLVETASASIGDVTFQAAIDGREANVACEHRPYLKMYGCCVRDIENTIWCVEQTGDVPLAERLEHSQHFLAGRLLGRDVLVIGFWSDWQYLNSILESALPAASPANIYLVDPDPDEKLAKKAEGMWTWAQKHHFRHVRASADDVLEELRLQFSRLFLKRVMKVGDANADVEWLDSLTTDDVYAIRRDLAGVNKVARHRAEEPNMGVFARAHGLINGAGATFDGGGYRVAGKRVRIVQAAGRMLSEVRAEFAKVASSVTDTDVVVCAAASDDESSPNIVRDDAPSTIIRGGTKGIRFTTTVEEALAGEGA